MPKKRNGKRKLSNVIVLLLVVMVDETDGVGLQSEGVKVGVYDGGVRAGGGGWGGGVEVWGEEVFCLIFLLSLWNFQNLCRAKKVQKKGGHVPGKTLGGFSFFLPLLLFAFAPHMFVSFGIWLPEEDCQSVSERGLWSQQLPTGLRMIPYHIIQYHIHICCHILYQ